MILYTNYVFADLVDLYRQKGIQEVKKYLDNELKNKLYWQKYFKNKNIKLGYYESKKYVILTEKIDKKISLFKVSSNEINLISKNKVIVGEKNGDKQIEGDLKTPEGVYDLTSKLTKLDSFYGPLALVTSYPNTYDKTLKKNGYGIWIHGRPLDKNKKRDEYTQGCIALDNLPLQKLDKNINVNKSVLLISNKNIKNVSNKDLSIILASIYKWRDAWKQSDIKTYISFYSKKFKRHDGMSLKRFKEYKERLFSRNEKKKIEFSNINVMPYPNSSNQNMYKIVMDEDYKTRTYKFLGKKELFIELLNGKVKILAEG